METCRFNFGSSRFWHVRERRDPCADASSTLDGHSSSVGVTTRISPAIVQAWCTLFKKSEKLCNRDRCFQNAKLVCARTILHLIITIHIIWE